MPALKQRTEILMPHYATFLRAWFRNYATARRELGLQGIDEGNFWRMLRGEPSRPDHIARLVNSMKKYGKDHKAYGWKEIQ